ncbi:SNF2-related protein [Lysinibacillus sp. UGB7]|uniref:SNF2-related protein n=1 Tax=Lysinibacillus sp. UGB7 TaxID=3411039 RepID=UPI003B78D9D9
MKMTLKKRRNQGFGFQNTKNINNNLMQLSLLESVGLHKRYQTELLRGSTRDRSKTKSKLTFDLLHRENVESIKDQEAIKMLQEYGVEIEGLDEAESIYQHRKKKHDFMGIPLTTYIDSEHFNKVKEQVKAKYGGVLQDGSSLFEYQVECASLIVGRRRLLNALDMGLGKTRTTIVGLTSDPRNKKILIVTMSRNFCDWENEFKSLGLGEEYIILKKPMDMRSTKRIHLVSYESWADETIKFRTKRKNTTERYSKKDLPYRCPSCLQNWIDDKYFCTCGETVIERRKKPLYKYLDKSYDAAAVDEGHLIKNGKTGRCKSIMAIKTKTRVLLSGTPAENGASDLFWPLAWLMGDSHHFWNKVDLSKFEAFGNFGDRCFRHVYGGVAKTALMDSSSISKRTSNEKALWEMQDIIMYRKLKKEPSIERIIRVPKPVHKRLHLEQTNAEKELYKKVLSDFSHWFRVTLHQRKVANARDEKYKSTTIEICSWLDKLRLAASCPWIHEDYKKNTLVQPSKLTFIREKMQQEARQKRKMLIFTAHKKTCEELGSLLDACVPGYEVGYIHGGVPMSRRFEMLTRFQDENDPLSVLIMTMKTGAESYTLTQAKSVILHDLDYNAKKIEQCYSRAVRLGQKDVVEITWLISVDTIDANMHSLILSKQSSVDLAIDRKELDFAEVAKEFEGQCVSGVGSVDYETFAKEMLSRGTSRAEYEYVS